MANSNFCRDERRWKFSSNNIPYSTRTHCHTMQHLFCHVEKRLKTRRLTQKPAQI